MPRAQHGHDTAHEEIQKALDTQRTQRLHQSSSEKRSTSR